MHANPIFRRGREATRASCRTRAAHASPRKPPWLLFAAAAILAPDIGTSRPLDDGRIGWSEAHFRASKLFVAVNASVAIVDVPADKLDTLLMRPGEGNAVEALGPAKALIFSTRAFGRRSRAELLIDANSGATLQRTSHDSGSRYRHRIYRYTDAGAYQRTRWPVSQREERLPADQWTQWSRFEEGMRPFPREVRGELITDPAALLYIVGAAPLDRTGDTFETLAYVRKNVHRVRIEVAGIDRIRIDYDQVGGPEPGRRAGETRALKLRLRGGGIGGGDAEFELLGLRGDIDLHIDPETRAPMQLEGRVKIAGHAVMRLTRLKLEETNTVANDRR
ncbi:MAG: hypothetical protein ACE5G3_09725 [Gammaproteobacteria bacterium]